MSDHKSEASQELKRQAEYAVTPSDLEQALAHLLAPFDAGGIAKEQAATMIWGAMGIGKTEIVRALAAKWGYRVVALHLPQLDPTDLKGIPVRLSDDTIVWKPSSYLPQEINIMITRDMVNEKGILKSKFEIPHDMVSAEDVAVTILNPIGNAVFRTNDAMCGSISEVDATANIDMTHREVTMHLKPSEKHKDLVGYTIRLTDKAILFLDELSAAVATVQNSALQLVLDKRVGEYDVPSNTPIVAAGNRESDAAFVHPMSAPLSNRFCHLRLMVSVDDWTSWALARRVHPHVIGFIQWQGSKALLDFDENQMEEGDGGFPTPRSWFKLSRQMTRELATPVMNAIITGFVGKAMGSTFIGYREICELLPSTDDILQGRPIELDKPLDIGQKYGIATALCYRLKDYHDKYYDDSISTDTPEEQADEWRIAASGFVEFVHHHLGKEMTTLCIHIVSRTLQISFIKFKGDKLKKFREFAHNYRDILRKIV